MKKFNFIYKVFTVFAVVALSMISFNSFAQANIAPLATITGDGTGGGGCRPVGAVPAGCGSLNDLVLGTCGSQSMWISTAGPPSTTPGDDYIEWTFPTARTFDSLIIHHAQTNARFLTGALVQFWNGASWVNHTTFSNLPQVCVNRVPIGKLTTDRFRITSWQAGTGQNSNMNFREIEIIEAPSGSNDAAVLSVDSPRVYCVGSQNVVATIGNFGINQIDSVEIAWEVNGVAQPSIKYVGLLDTINGLFPFQEQLVLGSVTFPAGPSTIRVYTFAPNGGVDTVNVNDTLDVMVNSAAAPLAINVNNITLTSAQVQAFGGAGTVEYEYGPAGFTLGAGTFGTSASSTFTLNSLTQGTTYDVYVRSNCGSNDTSVWVGPESFNTAYGIPFFQDFEAFTPGNIGNPGQEGWSANTVAVPDWEAEDANGADENSTNTGPAYDHTLFNTTGGIYIYLETSGGTNNAEADLISPPIYVDSSLQAVEFSFWYHMYGATINTLYVVADTNGVEDTLVTLAGQSQFSINDPWLEFKSFLTGYAGKSVILKFRGLNGTSFTGDMAVDDVRMDPVVQRNTAVTEVIDPSGSLCPGTVSPKVVIENAGIDTITTVGVVMDVNGVLDTITYTGSLATGDTAQVSFPSVTIAAATLYDFDYYTINPNGLTDLFNADDTLRIENLSTGLSGVATLDASSPASATNFQSFSALAAQLNSVGICGNVTINVAAGTYNDVFILDNVPGLNDSNTVTIDGSDSSLVTLVNDLTTENAVIRFIGTDYVTIKNMTVQNNNTGFTDNWGIHFTGNSRHDSIVNVRVLSNSTAFASNLIGASGSTSDDFAEGTNASFITVMNCDLRGAYYGFHFEGGGTGNYTNVGNAFINNNIQGVEYYPFYLDDQDSTSIIGNRVRDVNNANGDGIYAFDLMNFKINGNDIVSPDWGMYLSNANSTLFANAPAEIINNMIVSQSDFGMYLTSPILINMWHNSVHVEGTSDAVYLQGTFADSIDFRNNILSSVSSEVLYTNALDSNLFLKFDNNVFYTQGTSLLNFNFTTYADLAAYQLSQQSFTNNYNANSLEGNPQFLSSTDLHIVGTFVNNSGDNFVPVSTDIDGDTRPFPFSTIVDPGADEHDPPSCPPPANVKTFSPGLDSVTLVVVGGSNPDYQYEFVAAGAAQGTGFTGTITADSVRVGGLTASTSYDVYLREVCSRGDTSLWVGPIQFSTAFAVPFFQDFEAFAPGLFTNPWPEGWSSFPNQTSIFSFNWQSEDASGFNENGANTGPLYDHTQFGTAGGDYIYLESTYWFQNTDADFISPPIFIDSSQSVVEFSFWYFMYGATTDDLLVMVESNNVIDTVVILSGQQQTAQTDEWREMAVFLNGYENQTIQITFRGKSGGGNLGDISLDDVRVDLVNNNDAKVSNVVSPQLPICPGTTTPIVGVRNNGSDTLTSVDVVWDVNGVLDTTSYTGQILPGDTADVTLGNVSIVASTVYDIKFYTLDPNGIADEDVTNDTLSLDNLQTGFPAGTYTINSAAVTGGSNFTSFTDFANAVNTFGLCGAVVVDVVVGSGPYNEQVRFDNIQGLNSVNTLSINGHGEELTFATFNFQDRAGITVDNCSYMSFDSLDVTGTSTYRWGYHFTGNSDYNTVSNSTIDVGATSTSTNTIPIVASGSNTSSFSASDVDYLSVDNCELIGGWTAISIYGTFGDPNFGNTVINSRMVNPYQYGTYFYAQDSLLFEGNDYSRPTATNEPFTGYGFYLGGTSSGARINANAWHNTHDSVANSLRNFYVIYMAGDKEPSKANNYITNNLIYNINPGGTIYGIYEFGSDGANYINNTFSIDDTASTSTALTRVMYQTNSSTNSSFINNIISVTRGGTGAKHGIYLQNAATSMTVDYNDVYMNSAGTGAQSYGFYGANAADLTAWQTLSSGGANSFEVDPQFNTLDSLVPNQALINAVAQSSLFVTNDYFGVARTANPDIGAIEFDPPPVPNIGVTELVSPFISEDSCYTAAEDVIINLLNAGGVVLDFGADTAFITVDVSGAITQSLSVTLTNNSLNGNQPLGLGIDLDVNVGSINMTSPGTYIFQTTVSMSTDSFPANDVLNDTLILNPVTGGMIAGLDSICSGDSTDLTAENYQGTLQWQELIGSTWTDVVGATEATYNVKPTVNTSYRVLACGTGSSDTITVVPITIAAPTVVKNDSIVVSCGQVATDTLIMAGAPGTTLEWFDQPIGGNSVNTGDTLLYTDSTSAPALAVADTFYVEAGTGTGGRVGAIDRTIGTGGIFAQVNLSVQSLLFTVNQEFTLESVFLYPDVPGVVEIELRNPAGTVLQSTIVNVSNTAGERVPVGFTIPIGSYQLGANTANSTTGLYRNTAGASYPYISQGGAVSITGNTANLPGYYYYYYDWILAGCSSARTMIIGEVNCTVGIDNLIGETAALSIYPNPSEGLFTLNINTPQLENFNLTVRDLQGKTVYTKNVNVNGEYRDDLDFTGFAKGVYYLQIQTDTDTKVEKLIIQ